MKNVDFLLICVGAVGSVAVILAQQRYLKTALTIICREGKASGRSTHHRRR